MKIPTAFSPKMVSAACVMLAVASSALADGTIYLETGPNYSQSNPYQFSNGGEFTALTTGLASNVTLQGGLPAGSEVPVGYSSNATFSVGGVTGFETFCVEDAVDFYVGSTYHYTLGTSIQEGGARSSLTAGVAWLYEEFATGALPNYFNADRTTNAGQLQELIWQLQNENNNSSDPDFSIPETANIYYSALIGHFGTIANADALVTTTSNIYGVDVLELTAIGNPDSIAQDQLIYVGGGTTTTRVPVPDGGTTALLLGVAMLGLALLGRRLKAAVSA